MKTFKLVIIFLFINFTALGIGGLFMGDGAQSAWYNSLNRAPWTPPGWVFGVAWTSIMVCFSFYMAYLYANKPTLKIIVLFSIQFLLNIAWNYIFFNQQLVALGLINIIALTIVVGLFLVYFKNDLKLKTVLIAPYFIWLCIATSLNAYILIHN